ncbi:hypothetical protein BSKO_09151 [Bryopsis sp. KO-2023]|nr:hypothetical protein BSKO_09151 [Bryopsis sp. KO-2023]
MKINAITAVCVLACAAILTSELAAAAECDDKTPGEFPCEMEKLWGKCDAPWMKEGDFCMQTCGFCEEDGAESKDDAKPSRKKKRGVKPSEEEEDEELVAEEQPNLGDGSIIQVGETSFEVESPKTIEVSGVESFKGFKRKCKTIVETLENVPGASIMSELLSKLEGTEEELYELLDDKDTQYTVFVPLDTAFEPFLETLEDAEDPAVILNLVSNHMMDIVRHTRTMKVRTKLPTLVKSEAISVKSARGGTIVLANKDSAAEIVFPNVWACNSIMHFVDNVLPPSDL